MFKQNLAELHKNIMGIYSRSEKGTVTEDMKAGLAKLKKCEEFCDIRSDPAEIFYECYKQHKDAIPKYKTPQDWIVGENITLHFSNESLPLFFFCYPSSKDTRKIKELRENIGDFFAKSIMCALEDIEEIAEQDIDAEIKILSFGGRVARTSFEILDNMDNILATLGMKTGGGLGKMVKPYLEGKNPKDIMKPDVLLPMISDFVPKVIENVQSSMSEEDAKKIISSVTSGKLKDMLGGVSGPSAGGSGN